MITGSDKTPIIIYTLHTVAIFEDDPLGSEKNNDMIAISEQNYKLMLKHRLTRDLLESCKIFSFNIATTQCI